MIGPKGGYARRSVSTPVGLENTGCRWLKVVTENAWFAARPSGTEDVYKIYAESFRGEEHLKLVQAEAKALVDGVIS